MAATTGRTTNARGRATARAIEDAAIRLAVEHGVAALTVDQICAEAGVGQRTFFNHFPTKEDALLGAALPALDEGRVRAYLADPDAGVLSGLIGLVEVPDGPGGLVSRRREVLMASPALAERQASRLRPLADEVAGIVRLKLRSLDPGADDERIEATALLVTQIASALLLRPRSELEQGPVLEPLRWVWDRLL